MHIYSHDVAEGVECSEIRQPIELDMEYYKNLWKPNDLWRLATASYNLGVSIDCVYDHVVRLMKNVIKQFPDGFIGPASYRFIADISGWPLTSTMEWAFNITTQPDITFGLYPTDGFLKQVPATDKVCEIVKNNEGLYELTRTYVAMPDVLSQTVKCCYVVRDLDQWKYYIENSDPRIGDGKWGDVIINSGLMSFIPGIDTPEEYHRMLNRSKDPYERIPEPLQYYDLPDELHQQIEDGIGDRPWVEIVKEYNEGPEKQYVWNAKAEAFYDKNTGQPRVQKYTLNKKAQMWRRANYAAPVYTPLQASAPNVQAGYVYQARKKDPPITVRFEDGF